MCESRNKRVPPRVSIQGSIVTVVDPSICQTSTPNDMKSSTTVTRCCITLHLNSNLDRLRKPELNIVTTILGVRKDIDSS